MTTDWYAAAGKTLVRGAAHFPGTGPSGLECGDCAAFQKLRGKDDFAPGPCAKYAELMRTTTKRAPRIRPTTRACRYFTPR